MRSRRASKPPSTTSSPPRRDHMTPSIFVIGFPKSGTTSIHEALEKAGLRSAHWTVESGEYCGELIYRAHGEGKNPLAYLMDYDAITQADICLPRQQVNGRP